MTPSFPYSPYLQKRAGPSPEKNHQYECYSCPNQTGFLGIDDRGIPGRNYICPHCGRPAVVEDGKRCWCPAYASFKQNFSAKRKGQEPDREPFRLNDPQEIQGGRIGNYTRIYCGKCQDLVWVGREGLGRVAGQLIGSSDSEVLEGQEGRFLREIIHQDLRGVLEHIERNPANDPLTEMAHDIEDREWQEALDRSLARSFYDGLGNFYFSQFLRQRTEMDERLTQILFTQFFKREGATVETCLQINHRDMGDLVEVEPASLFEALRNQEFFFEGFYPSRITEILENPLVQTALKNKEELQEVLDQLAGEHPRIATTLYRHTQGLELNTERLQDGMLQLSRRYPQEAIEWLEEHAEIQEALLNQKVVEALLQVPDAQLRRRAITMARHTRLDRNAQTQPQSIDSTR